MSEPFLLRGMRIFPGYLPRESQGALVEELRALLRTAPLFRPQTPHGPMRVRISSAGDFGWISDAQGYRYARHHPNGQPWPAIPARLLALWDALADCPHAPECCLINFYDSEARMGLHQDRDEADFSAPVLSLSLGDDARFRVGGTTRGGPTQSLWLRSGDVVVMGGAARLAYHGIDKLRPGSSRLLPKGGRINLTLRVVT